MLTIFKRDDVVSFIVLVLLAFIVRLHYFIYPLPISSFESFHRAALSNFNFLYVFYKSHPQWCVFISTWIYILFGVYLSRVMYDERLTYKNSYLPAVSFVLSTALVPSLSVVSVAGLASLCVFMSCIKLCNTHAAATPRYLYILSGSLVGIACILYVPALIFVLAFPVITIFFRAMNVQQILAYLLGVMIPAYLIFALYYLAKGIPKRSDFFSHTTLPLDVIDVKHFFAISILSLVLLVYALYLLNQQRVRYSVVIRKKWGMIFRYFIAASVAGLFSVSFPGHTWVLPIIPFSMLLSQCFYSNNEKYNTFTFYAFVLSIIAIQWFT